jgi:hypothetical protein
VCLGDSSMRLGVPFIAPRQLGAVGDQQGRLRLPSVRWCTGQSDAPPDSHCSCPVRDLLPILAQVTVAAPGRLAHRTVRCPPPTVGVATRRAKIARLIVGADDHCLTGQSGVPPDSAVNYSRTPPNSSRERPIHWSSAWRTGHCPVPDRTVRCARPSWTLVVHSQVTCNPFLLFFSLFLALRQNMLVIKTMY